MSYRRVLDLVCQEGAGLGGKGGRLGGGIGPPWFGRGGHPLPRRASGAPSAPLAAYESTAEVVLSITSRHGATNQPSPRESSPPVFPAGGRRHGGLRQAIHNVSSQGRVCETVHKMSPSALTREHSTRAHEQRPLREEPLAKRLYSGLAALPRWSTARRGGPHCHLLALHLRASTSHPGYHFLGYCLVVGRNSSSFAMSAS